MKQSKLVSKKNFTSGKKRINSSYHHKSVDLAFNPYKPT
jgi:hypothetical protein